MAPLSPCALYGFIYEEEYKRFLEGESSNSPTKSFDLLQRATEVVART